MMVKEAIAKGSTVQEAFENACKELGVDTSEASCEVLELPTKKTFGIFGGKPARVKATVEIEEPAPKAVEEKPRPVQEARPVKRPEERPVKTEKSEKKPAPAAEKKPAPVPPEKKPAGEKVPEEKVSEENRPGENRTGDPAQEASDYLGKVLKSMGIDDAEIEITRGDDAAVLNLKLSDVSLVIGHRGETVDALQYLASLVANRVGGSYYRIMLDVGDYRERRRATLESLGRRMAVRAVKSGRNTALEPMNPYERRIIHTAVQTIDGATSWSEGDGTDRHVVIGPKVGERGYRRRNTRTYDRRPYNGGSAPRRENTQTEAPAPQRHIDESEGQLYGKIEVKK